VNEHEPTFQNGDQKKRMKFFISDVFSTEWPGTQIWNLSLDTYAVTVRSFGNYHPLDMSAKSKFELFICWESFAKAEIDL
jgi:hypothetical protein